MARPSTIYNCSPSSAQRSLRLGASVDIFLSGVHSGPNPSPGLGTARSLRLAFPNIRLTAVDYSPASTGLHDRVFDEVLLNRPWPELDLATYRRQIESALGRNAWWLSGLDLEVLWLSPTAGRSRSRMLVPDTRALSETRKPEIRAAHGLGWDTPAFISLAESDRAVHAFCRAAGWRVWVKGPNYEARSVRTWADVRVTREAVAETWASDDIFAQAHVAGSEESVALAAFQGRLLAAVQMRKQAVTPEGKTWSGLVEPIAATLWPRLQRVVEDLNWTGGAEIECVRDLEGRVWVIDWNPRFPAWINGASILGFNLPAALVAAAEGLASPPVANATGVFVRVVNEIAARPRYESPIEAAAVNPLRAAKHPSGMPDLSRRLQTPSGRKIRRTFASDEDAATLRDLARISPKGMHTPQRVTLAEKLDERLAAITTVADRISDETGLSVRPAYSVKTDPDPEIIRRAIERGWMIEVISQLEARRAFEAGCRPGQLVVNGPAKSWPSPSVVEPRDVFLWVADSLIELRRLIEAQHPPSTIAFRLRLPRTWSRFGIDLTEVKDYVALVSLLRRTSRATGLAVHYHFASSETGYRAWARNTAAVLVWARSIAQDSGRRLAALDIGGGWHPDDIEGYLAESVIPRLRETAAEFPDLRTLVLEPGKAVAQPAKALIATVVEVRPPIDRGVSDVVLDASIAELPRAADHPHQAYWRRREGRTWRRMTKADGRALGRICMEADVIASDIAIPAGMRPGDFVAITEAGGYDASMSYDFARG